MDAINLSFKFSLFQVGNQVVEQIRGAPMGSPLSPSLCHAVLSLFEDCYFRRLLHNAVFREEDFVALRYVDN